MLNVHSVLKLTIKMHTTEPHTWIILGYFIIPLYRWISNSKYELKNAWPVSSSGKQSCNIFPFTILCKIYVESAHFWTFIIVLFGNFYYYWSAYHMLKQNNHHSEEFLNTPWKVTNTMKRIAIALKNKWHHFHHSFLVMLEVLNPLYSGNSLTIVFANH